MEQNRKRSFWDFSCNDILGILCAAAVPIALGIYTAITYQQEHENARKIQELKVKQAIELRQATIFDLFLDNIFKLEKNGYLNESHGPLWAFANAYYRAAHRQLDHGRKADVLQFLKEKELIGRNCTTLCGSKIQPDIIRLNELDFDKVYFRSDTGTLNQLNVGCVSFDDVSMSSAMFPNANLNCASFDRARLNNVSFGSSSLVGASFDGTDLEGVDFANAILTNARFRNVDLSSAILTDEQIRQAHFWNVIMPNGATIRRTTASTDISCTVTCTSEQTCVRGVCVGVGSLGISLVWSREGDGDLSVTTPNNKTIYYDNRNASETTDWGQLDRDDMNGTGPENIYWPSNGKKPPYGMYHVCFNALSFALPINISNPLSFTVNITRPMHPVHTVPKNITSPSAYESSESCFSNSPGYVTSFTYP